MALHELQNAHMITTNRIHIHRKRDISVKTSTQHTGTFCTLFIRSIDLVKAPLFCFVLF